MYKCLECLGSVEIALAKRATGATGRKNRQDFGPGRRGPCQGGGHPARARQGRCGALPGPTAGHPGKPGRTLEPHPARAGGWRAVFTLAQVRGAHGAGGSDGGGRPGQAVAIGAEE